MKRKYLSALLMGTLAVASTSTFTSCKDYDDDISNLQEQIDKLATADQLTQKVSELQALISANSSDISSLQTKLSEALAAAQKAQTTADSKTTLNEVKDILADYATKEYVDNAEKALNAAIKALQDGDIASLKTAVAEAKEAAQAAADKADSNKAEILEQLKEYATKTEVAEAKEAAEQLAKDLAAASNAQSAAELAKAVEQMNTKVADTKAEILDKLAEYATTEAMTNAINAAKKDVKDDLQAQIDLCASQKALDDAIKEGKAADEAAAELNKTEREKVAKAAQDALDEQVEVLKNLIQKAQDKADLAESEKGMAYVKALEALNKANAAATDATTALANAKTNKESIDKIENALGTGFDAQNTVAQAIKLIQEDLKIDGTGALAGLDGRLKSIEATLKGVEGDDTALGLSTKVANIEAELKKIIGQYSTMVTDIQLYKFTSAETDFDNTKLNFVQAAEQANVFPGEGVADAQFTFVKGNYFVGEDSLLVRVSPVDAELTASNVSLLNSQGKELNDLIEVTDAHRYTKLLYGSRAAGVNTGLWVVKFKAKDLGDDFKAAAITKVNGDEKSILYSVAVKNNYTTDEVNTRRVTSEYGVGLYTEEANHAYDFCVNGKPIKDIHNRYEEYTDAPELVWKDQTKPSTTVTTTGNDANAENRPSTNNNDNRHSAKLLAVEKGKDIVIDFTKVDTEEDPATNKDFGVKGFYVTLDEKFAYESAPSELNAWNSYSYENVGYKKNGTTYVPAKLFTGNKGTIKINDLGNVKGDVIGFRVYAVNYDGTLTDPDGRAFYVAVGDAKVDMTIPVTDVTFNKNFTSPKFESDKIAVDFSGYDFDATAYTWTVTAKDASGAEPTEFEVKYFDKDGNSLTELSKDVKSIQFVLTEPGKFVDDATYEVKTTLKKSISGAEAEVCEVKASFHKAMPKEAPTFGYRDGFSKTPEYIVPADNYKVNTPDANGNIVNKGGSFDFRNILIINNNVTAWNGIDLFGEGVFNFKVANGTYKTEDNKTSLTDAYATVNGSEKYILKVENNGSKNLVDNTTERDITADFVYANISKKQVKNNATNKMEWQEKLSYKVPSASSEKIVYCSWMKTFEIPANGGDSWVGKAATYKKDANGNYILDENGEKIEESAPILAGNVVEWSTTETSKELYLKNVTASVKDIQLIPTSANSTVKGKTLATFFTNGVVALVNGTYGEVYTTSADGKQINPYYTASYANGKITLTQKNQTSIPSSVKGGLIHFTVRDCFGNTKAISLPFVIKMPEVSARKH